MLFFMKLHLSIMKNTDNTSRTGSENEENLKIKQEVTAVSHAVPSKVSISVTQQLQKQQGQQQQQQQQQRQQQQQPSWNTPKIPAFSIPNIGSKPKPSSVPINQFIYKEQGNIQNDLEQLGLNLPFIQLQANLSQQFMKPIEGSQPMATGHGAKLHRNEGISMNKEGNASAIGAAYGSDSESRLPRGILSRGASNALNVSNTDSIRPLLDARYQHPIFTIPNTQLRNQMATSIIPRDPSGLAAPNGIQLGQASNTLDSNLSIPITGTGSNLGSRIHNIQPHQLPTLGGHPTRPPLNLIQLKPPTGHLSLSGSVGKSPTGLGHLAGKIKRFGDGTDVLDREDDKSEEFDDRPAIFKLLGKHSR